MKKLIIGILIGFVLSFAASAYADELKSLIGRTIEGEFPVTVDGKRLENKAIVIDGTSYLPVRAIADAVYQDVHFDADLGITLTPKEVPAVPVETDTPSEAIEPEQNSAPSVAEQIAALQGKISFINSRIKSAEDGKVLFKSDAWWGPNADVSGFDTQIADLQAQKADLEAQLAALQAQQ